MILLTLERNQSSPATAPKFDSGKVVVPLSKINPKHANKSIVGKQGVEPKEISFYSDFSGCHASNQKRFWKVGFNQSYQAEFIQSIPLY